MSGDRTNLPLDIRPQVFYRVLADRILVVRILYDQTDFEQYLPDETEN